MAPIVPSQWFTPDSSVSAIQPIFKNTTFLNLGALEAAVSIPYSTTDPNPNPARGLNTGLTNSTVVTILPGHQATVTGFQHPMSAGIIVGSALGGFVVFVLVMSIITCSIKRCRARRADLWRHGRVGSDPAIPMDDLDRSGNAQARNAGSAQQSQTRNAGQSHSHTTSRGWLQRILQSLGSSRRRHQPGPPLRQNVHLQSLDSSKDEEPSTPVGIVRERDPSKSEDSKSDEDLPCHESSDQQSTCAYKIFRGDEFQKGFEGQHGEIDRTVLERTDDDKTSPKTGEVQISTEVSTALSQQPLRKKARSTNILRQFYEGASILRRSSSSPRLPDVYAGSAKKVSKGDKNQSSEKSSSFEGSKSSGVDERKRLSREPSFKNFYDARVGRDSETSATDSCMASTEEKSDKVSPLTSQTKFEETTSALPRVPSDVHLNKRPSSSLRALVGTPNLHIPDDTSVYSRTVGEEKEFDAFDPAHGKPTRPVYRSEDFLPLSSRDSGHRKLSHTKDDDVFDSPPPQTKTRTRKDSGVHTDDIPSEGEENSAPLAMILGVGSLKDRGTPTRTAFVNLSRDEGVVSQRSRDKKSSGGGKERYPGLIASID